MTAALRKARAQARATGQARIGSCVIGEMSRPYAGPRLEGTALLSALRVREIESVIRRRHGAYVPDATNTDDAEICHGYILAVGGSLGEVRGWSARWLPWMRDEAVLSEAETLRTKLLTGRRGPRILPADAIAKMLFVTLKERTELGLRTIGACDRTAKERKGIAKARKIERDRERQRARRAAENRTPRSVYTAASAETTKPWLAEGVSRRTWYRRRNGTGPSRIKFNSIDGDTLVPIIDSLSMPSLQGDGPGSGDVSPAVLQEAAPHGVSDRRAAHG